MTLLSIETTGTIFSALIWKDGNILNKFHLNEAHAVSKKIAPVIQNLLIESNLNVDDIDYALYNCGPGSFTGLRVALSFLKGLFFMDESKIIAIPSFDILNDTNTEQRIALFESKRDELYILEDKKIITLKKTLFQEKYEFNKAFVTYSELRPSSIFENYDIKIKAYDAEHLVTIFLRDDFNKSANEGSELIYVYE